MLKKLTAYLLCIVAASQVTAAEPNLAATPAIADFSPGPDYADSARMFQGIPGIERAANGRLWATWYGGGRGEDEHNYILLSTSGDNGKSWQPVLVLDPDREGPVRALDPCLWHDPEGKLWLFWAQEATKDKARDPSSFVSFAITTTDSGSADARWSAPQQIAKGVMMNKPTVTKEGRWLLPMASWSQEGSARVLESTDQGKTFVELGAANVPVKSRSADEHMIVERKDGTLWMLVRGAFPPASKAFTGIGESVSTDGGKTWSEATASGIPHPVSRFFIRRLASGRLLLVRHDPPNHGKSRSHLTAQLSEDDGRTWKGGLMLDERDGVSYPDGVQAPDGSITLIYDYQRHADKEILMAVFTEKEVLEGRIGSPGSRLRVLVDKATGTKPAGQK
jgi:predicted neuraminidase